MNESVSEDVVKVFRGKTLTQLVLLQDSIRQKLDGGEGIDVGEWGASPPPRGGVTGELGQHRWLKMYEALQLPI